MRHSATASNLLETAARLFHEQGYAATGVARILEGAEAGSGSLYYFYPTKEDLLQAVLDRYRERLEEEIFTPVRKRVQDPIERVFGVLAFYQQFLEASQCSLGCPIGNLAAELSDSHPVIREAIASLFDLWRAGIRGFLEDARGRLPSGTDLDSLSALVLSVMEGGVMQARAARKIEPFDRSVAMLRDYFDRLAAKGQKNRRQSSSKKRRPGKGSRG